MDSLGDRRRMMLVAACLALAASVWLGVGPAQRTGSARVTDGGSPGGMLAWLGARPVGMRLGETPDHHAVVQSVRTDGTAHRAGLEPGDELERVGDRTAPTPEDAAIEIGTAWAAGKSAIDLVVTRNNRSFYAALRLRD